MGILSRFRDIMASNINALLEKAENPEKSIDDFMRKLSSDLGQVKAETASIIAQESRAKRALDECQAEIAKLQRYAEKCAEAGNAEDARKFLERKAALLQKEAELNAAYEMAANNVANINQLHDKLSTQIGQLEERRAKLKDKIAATKVQQSLNSIGSGGNIDSALKDIEEKVNKEYDEAMAIAELREGAKDDFDEQFAQWQRQQSKSDNEKKD